MQRYKATGCYKAYRRGGNRPATLQNLLGVIADWIGAERDITLAEMAARLKSDYQTYASLSGLSDMLRRNGYTYKKNDVGGRGGTWQAPKAAS